MEINLELLKEILLQIQKHECDYFTFKNYVYETDEIYQPQIIHDHENLIVRYELAEYTNGEQARKMRVPVYLFSGLTNKGEDFLNAIKDEEIYNQIEPIINSYGLSKAIKKASQLSDAKCGLESPQTGNVINNNLQGAKFGGGFANRDYLGNVTNNNYDNTELQE